MFGEVLIFLSFFVVSFADLSINGAYAPSSWRPGGVEFDLPNEYNAFPVQRPPLVEFEVSKERVDYVGQLKAANSLQSNPKILNYLPPPEIDAQVANVNKIQVDDFHNIPGIQFNLFNNPKLNIRDYYTQSQVGRFQKSNFFPRTNEQRFSAGQYGTPEVEQLMVNVANKQASGYNYAPSTEPFIKENDRIIEDSVTKGEYFILTPERTLQKVSYKTSQTQEEARNNGFTAVLIYKPVNKIDGPLYKYNDQGQLVRIYKK